jgi:aminocarboxymuconate-semialdehyde decarboxylase
VVIGENGLIKRHCIDIHAHYFPQSYLDLIAAEGLPFGATCTKCDGAGPIIDVGELHAGPLERRFIELDLRIADMDVQGVDMQVLSLTQPMVYWSGKDLSRRLSEAFNDALIAGHEEYPKRLVGLAILPMQDPGLAIAELDRIAGETAIRGVYMATRILDRDLSDPVFFPVFERIEDCRMPVFLHPLTVIGFERLKPYFLNNLLGNPFDTAVAAAHLIFGGVLDRFPKLDIVLPHAGGAFPFLAGRLDHGWKVRKECRHLANGPIHYLKRFFYDTIAHSPESLGHLLELVGPERIMLGSDYCFDMGIDRPVDVVLEHPGLSVEARRAVLAENAQRLLRL